MSATPRPSVNAYLLGTMVGVAYGLSARILAEPREFGPAFAVMTFAFVVIVPVVIGYLTVRPVIAPTWGFRIFGPWPACMATVLMAALLGMEGMICIVMALPLMLVLASLGGALGGAAALRANATALPILVLLPYVVGPMERGRELPTQLAETRTTIDVAAPPNVVWPLVASVDSIRSDEERPALYTAMGFPHPVSAVIDRPSVGGVRLATFTGGLVFTEKVTDWDRGRRLRFTIRANTDAIPPSTLDPHVTIGGPYFDVMAGTYELQPLAGGGTRIVLTSEHRVTTPFNAYAAMWTDLVMRSIQSSILDIIKARAERSVSAGPVSAPRHPAARSP